MAALLGISSRCSLTRDMVRRLDFLVWWWRPRQTDWLQVVSGCMLKFSLDCIPTKAKKLVKLFSPLSSKPSAAIIGSLCRLLCLCSESRVIARLSTAFCSSDNPLPIISFINRLSTRKGRTPLDKGSLFHPPANRNKPSQLDSPEKLVFAYCALALYSK